MKFKVDQEICIGCAACEGTSPEVFELGAGEGIGRFELVEERRDVIPLFL